jgi:hypothetical protein
MAIVRTARGRNLDIDDLKLRQRKPMNKLDMKDKIEKMQRPTHQPTIHGHMPSMEGVMQPTAVIVESIQQEDEPSIADFTGIVVEGSGERPENLPDATTTLNTIIGNLEQMRKHDVKGDAKGRRIK